MVWTYHADSTVQQRSNVSSGPGVGFSARSLFVSFSQDNFKTLPFDNSQANKYNLIREKSLHQVVLTTCGHVSVLEQTSSSTAQKDVKEKLLEWEPMRGPRGLNGPSPKRLAGLGNIRVHTMVYTMSESVCVCVLQLSQKHPLTHGRP